MGRGKKAGICSFSKSKTSKKITDGLVDLMLFPLTATIKSSQKRKRKK